MNDTDQTELILLKNSRLTLFFCFLRLIIGHI